jgi:hypothetical protein
MVRYFNVYTLLSRYLSRLCYFLFCFFLANCFVSLSSFSFVFTFRTALFCFAFDLPFNRVFFLISLLFYSFFSFFVVCIGLVSFLHAFSCLIFLVFWSLLVIFFFIISLFSFYYLCNILLYLHEIDGIVINMR